MLYRYMYVYSYTVKKSELMVQVSFDWVTQSWTGWSEGACLPGRSLPRKDIIAHALVSSKAMKTPFKDQTNFFFLTLFCV